MRTVGMLVALVTLVASSAVAQDPTVVDSTHYKLEFENEYVRVLRISYGPYERSVMHSHPPAVAVFLTNQEARFTLPGGGSFLAAGRAGETGWAAPGTHQPENITENRFEMILVELKTTSDDDN